MCGIVGGYGANVQNAWVSAQTTKISHRGPDFQQDVIFSNFLHFGSARLAMTDPLPRSNQPFRSENSMLVFNGEIYNHKKLRKELETIGVSFETESDTEVLIKYLDHWGESTCQKIEGMYAFVYFNSKENMLILSRDPLGKKPLYFSISNQTIHWSSSLKSLRELQENQILNTKSMGEYLTLGYTLDPTTIIQDIFAVQPGHILKFTLQGELLKEIKPTQARLRKNLPKIHSSFREVLTSAVASRVEGHATSAISLSGGLDSAITALLASQTDSKIVAYSASWPDSDKSRYNTDAASARIIAKNLKIDFQEVEIFEASELDRHLREFVRAMEEPNSNPSGLSMMNLYKSISQDSHRLVLTGDGADEILGGYPRYQSLARMPNYLKVNSNLLSKQLDRQRNSANLRILQLLVSQSSNRNFHNWLHWHWNFTPAEIAKLSPEIFSNSNSGSLRRKLELIEPDFSAVAISFNMQMDREIWLGMESNRKLDRISMHYSIEARSPFQDENVIDAALKYMEKTKYKVLGKKLLLESFPEMQKIGIRDDKAGFISPVGHWLRSNPAVVTDSLTLLTKELPLNRTYLMELSKAPYLGEYRNIMKLWSLIVLSYWIQDIK